MRLVLALCSLVSVLFLASPASAQHWVTFDYPAPDANWQPSPSGQEVQVVLAFEMDPKDTDFDVPLVFVPEDPDLLSFEMDGKNTDFDAPLVFVPAKADAVAGSKSPFVEVFVEEGDVVAYASWTDQPASYGVVSDTKIYGNGDETEVFYLPAGLIVDDIQFLPIQLSNFEELCTNENYDDPQFFVPADPNVLAFELDPFNTDYFDAPLVFVPTKEELVAGGETHWLEVYPEKGGGHVIFASWLDEKVFLSAE